MPYLCTFYSHFLNKNGEKEMKTIIVYYSLEGNTDYAAKHIASELGADLLRLEPEKAYPSSGFKKFFWGGKSAVMAETPKLVPYTFNSSAYDRIVFGFPVWAGNVTPPIRTFVKENNLDGKLIAAYACESGAGAEKAFEKLKAALGIETFEAELILIDPKTKPSEENDQKLKLFCSKLM
jgi:flavodoxin